MTDAHGQHSHVSGAPSQVLVDRESRRRARIRPAIAARVARRGVNFPDRDFYLFSANQRYSLTRECFLCHKRPSDNHFCDFRFHEPPYKLNEDEVQDQARWGNFQLTINFVPRVIHTVP